jgi:thiamine biosynthesis lipoprotein
VTPLIAAALLFAGATATFLSYSHHAMATRIDVLLPSDASAAAADQVFAIFDRVDATMSEWKDTSPLARVNKSAGVDAVAVPDDLFGVVERAVDFGRMTGGAFDLTWAALWGLWDFRGASPRVPDPAAVAAAVALVDFRDVVLDKPERQVALRRRGMKIGLGGIAKGYALDESAARLRALGITSFLLSAGGQIYAGGKRGEQPWRVAVRDPRGEATDQVLALDVEDASVSTSGDYERFFTVDGVRYHHILDPHTGYPARGLRSATVVSADATWADALSTALMVMTAAQRDPLLRAMPEVGTVLIDDQGRVSIGPSLQARVVRSP